MRRIYIRSPIYYAIGDAHLGSAYTMLITDTLARYYRVRGWDTFFLTGTDEHGDKIEKAAAEAGVTPKELTDKVSASFRAAWDECHISYDHFIRTTDAYHTRYVQEVLAKLYAADEIYFGAYQGLYCFGCERFYTQKELRDGKCPDHLTEPKLIEEETYFFRMSKYQDRLLQHIEAQPDFIRPEGFKNEVVAMLREPIGDLSISRPKTRLTWGIEMPFDTRYVTYVWFDALLNYISGLKYQGEDVFEKFWPEAEHFIGKDILKPHGVFWPTMLMAMGVPLYRHLNVHGFWTVEGQKMSKSLGNVISPLTMKEKIGLDAFRYFLLRESVFGQDADFREDSLHARYNAELANNLGNLVSRTLAMQDRYFKGIVQPLSNPPLDIDRRLETAFIQAASAVEQHVKNLSLSRALEAVFRATDHANKYITETAPFTLAKDQAALPRVGAILHNLVEALRVSAQLLTPFLPETCEKIFTLLALPPERQRNYDLPWGKAFAPGHQMQKPQPLFPRLA
jgi:methionyl-tRNA synthetase